MLTADNLIPRRVAQTPRGRVVTFWQPEDFAPDHGEEVRAPSPQEIISGVMRANPERDYCAADFDGVNQKAAGTALGRLRDKGLIVPTFKRHMGGAGGRQTQFFRWGEA